MNYLIFLAFIFAALSNLSLSAPVRWQDRPLIQGRRSVDAGGDIYPVRISEQSAHERVYQRKREAESINPYDFGRFNFGTAANGFKDGIPTKVNVTALMQALRKDTQQ